VVGYQFSKIERQLAEPCMHESRKAAGLLVMLGDGATATSGFAQSTSTVAATFLHVCPPLAGNVMAALLRSFTPSTMTLIRNKATDKQESLSRSRDTTASAAKIRSTQRQIQQNTNGKTF
jgi:hypothetical protein